MYTLGYDRKVGRWVGGEGDIVVIVLVNSNINID